MRRLFPIAVYVAAVLAGQLSVRCQEPAPPVPRPVADGLSAPAIRLPQPPYGSIPVAGPENQFNGFAVHRANPDLGAPGSAAHGFQHFLFPMDKYTTWYRPRAASLTAWERCAPDSFRPRGFGHLFARPCDGFRMEYSPYVLPDGSSQYGPSYLARQPDPRCDDCDHTAKSGQCPNCR